MKIRTVTALLLPLVPAFSLAMAYLSRWTFWEASGGFFAQVPQYALAVFLLQLPPFLVSELSLRRSAAIRLGRSGWLIGWGAYEIVSSIFLVRIFSPPELWIASVGLTYLGLGSMIIGLINRL